MLPVIKNDSDFQGNAFSKSRVQRILLHFSFWMAILAFFTIFPYIITGEPIAMLALRNLVYLPSDIVLVYFIIEYLIPVLFIKKKYILFALSVIGVFLVNTIVSFLIDEYIMPLITGVQNADKLPRQVFYSILAFSFIGGFASVIKLIRINNSIMLKKESIEARYHKAELFLLRSQINPHFLFNVFNNIDELIFKDRDKASEVLAFLSDSLRYVLQESDSDFVALESEIKFIRSFIEVASISFADEGFISFTVFDECYGKGKVIAPMIFIPFIENTIKHCDRRSEAPGIEISIICRPGIISLLCRNRIKAEKPDYSSGGGFGLANVRKRLDMTYGEKHVLNILSEDGWYLVDLKIFE